MIDLNKIVNDTLATLEKENYVENIVKARFEKTIKDIVDDVFREYSDFGKALKKHIEENLNVNLDKLELSGYNSLILAALKEKLDAVITVQGIEKVKEATEKMLSDVKREYKLSEIIEKIKEGINQDDVNYDDRMTLIIEPTSGGYCHIYIDEEEKDYKYSCDYQINIDKEGKPYSITLRDETLDTRKILGGLYGADALLFKIYGAGSKIVLDHGTDPEDYDLYLSDEDY